MFFYCLPEVQIWAIFKIPSNSNTFPYRVLFTNMDYLYWRVFSHMKDQQFAWILWYIWKRRNNKVFSNIYVDPRDTLNIAETESLLWIEAHASITQGITQYMEMERTSLPSISGRWCFTDESWKERENYLGKRLV